MHISKHYNPSERAMNFTRSEVITGVTTILLSHNHSDRSNFFLKLKNV